MPGTTAPPMSHQVGQAFSLTSRSNKRLPICVHNINQASLSLWPAAPWKRLLDSVNSAQSTTRTGSTTLRPPGIASPWHPPRETTSLLTLNEQRNPSKQPENLL